MLPEEYATLILELKAEIERLKGRVAELEQRNQALEERHQALEAENQQLKELLHEKGVGKGAKAPQFKENYSVEQQAGKSKRGQKSTGRRPQGDKQSFVQWDVDVYPIGVSEAECIEQRQQYAWRLIEGQAEYVCYPFMDLQER
jgi:regulator of replication initiation timing